MMISSLNNSKFIGSVAAPTGKAVLRPTAPSTEPTTASLPSESLKSDIPEGLKNISPSRLAEMTARLENKEFVPGELVVGLKLKTESSDFGSNPFQSVSAGLNNFSQHYGVKISENLSAGQHKSVKDGEEIAMLRVKLPEGLGEAEALAAMQDDSRIASADVNEIFRLPEVQEESPLPSPATSAWGLYDSQVNGPVIAIIDHGVQTDHPDLQSYLWRNPGEIPGNGLDDDSNGVVDDYHGFNAIDNSGNLSDPSGQGTHVAGLIAGLGTSELNPPSLTEGPKLLAVKIFKEGSNQTDTATIIKGIKYAENMGARITSNPLNGAHNRVLDGL